MHNATTRSIQSWTASALIHGLAFGAAMTLLSDLPKLAQREPFVWTVSLVEPPPAPTQTLTVHPASPPSQAKAAQSTPAQARPTETPPVVRTVQPVQQIQQVHEVVRREVREPRPVSQEVVHPAQPSSQQRAERRPVPRAHELVQREASEARSLVQEAGPITQQTQEVVSEASSPVSTNRQELSVETQLTPTAQSIGTIQSAAAQSSGTAQSVQVSQRPTVQASSTPSSMPASVPVKERIAVPSASAGPSPSSVVPQSTFEPAPTPAASQDSSTLPAAPVPVQVHPSPLEQAKTQSLPTPTSLRTKADYGWLARELWNRVERLKRYPRLARMHGWEGKVVVRAVIKADGSLLQEDVEESSGHEALDQDALDLMKQVCPLTLKHALGQSQIVVHVPIHYRIEQ